VRLTPSRVAAGCAWLLSLPPLAVAPVAATADTYTVHISCTVPKGQGWRQLSPKSCQNVITDHGQTFTAKVRNSRGHPVAGVRVTFTDNDAVDAHFRTRNQVCMTDSTGKCSDELVDSAPKHGEVIKATASIGGSSDTGSLVFQ